jgi:hypothetical protein
VSFYSDMQALAKGLLTEFDQGGLAIGVHTSSGPAHAPVITYPETPFVGAVRGVTAQNMADTLVQASDLVVTMPGDGIVPGLLDRIVIGGLYHTIVKITPKPATGTVAAFEVIVRK